MKPDTTRRERPSERRVGAEQRGAAGLVAQYIQELSGRSGVTRPRVQARPLAVARPCEG